LKISFMYYRILIAFVFVIVQSIRYRSLIIKFFALFLFKDLKKKNDGLFILRTRKRIQKLQLLTVLT
ncbi:MAG: hypothetical protein ACFFDI_02470, partial [Promethearchaeota archaeon]